MLYMRKAGSGLLAGVDPDIPADPYCRKCLDKEKHKVMMKLLAMDKK